ncbi:unnamed protein product [Moneuplotes crassus]|uniref:EamA domain-containing protein n=1 Tax=Euplotes crassus TaxID=5936 RepID=A0AAD1XFB3_EUPCR|nr:unnamed protein product [Moneuplotes crassus]
MNSTIDNLKLITLIVLMLALSSSHGIMLKFMNTVKVTVGTGIDEQEKSFEHPFFQTFTMFMGNSLCMVIYLIQNRKSAPKSRMDSSDINIVDRIPETEPSVFIFAIPMLCDAASSTLYYIGYINVQASIVQMLGGFLILSVDVLSIIFLKKKQYRHHWIGIISIFMGIALVATTALMSKGDSSSKNPALGVPVLLISLMIKGCQHVVEEKLLGSYNLNPMKVMGCEGIAGVLFFSILLPILQYVPCNSELCNNGVVENTQVALTQISMSGELVFYVVVIMMLDGGMNGLGMEIIKYASAANRVTLQQLRTVAIWLFFLIVPLIVDIRVQETFSFLQLGGFLILLFGVIIYNEIIKLPSFCIENQTDQIWSKNLLKEKLLDLESNQFNSIHNNGCSLNSSDNTQDYTPPYTKFHVDIRRKNFYQNTNGKNLSNVTSTDGYIRLD